MSFHLPRFIATIAAAALSALTLSSCVDYSGAPYGGGGSYAPRPPSRSYGYRAPAYGGPRPYRNYGYGDPYYGGSSYHNYNRHRGQNDDRIKLTGGAQRGKPNRPEGYHSREWYEKRGYDLDQYKHKHQDSGRTHAGEDYRKKSSSSSKGKKKKK